FIGKVVFKTGVPRDGVSVFQVRVHELGIGRSKGHRAIGKHGVYVGQDGRRNHDIRKLRGSVGRRVLDRAKEHVSEVPIVKTTSACAENSIPVTFEVVSDTEAW